MKTQLPKIALTALAVHFALSIASAANIPRNCAEEITIISKESGFDMQTFISDLPLAVGKAKLQAKVPFGKPKDGDKMDIGMTFGCLKAFPESPGEIASLLKDIGLGAAKNMMANKSETSANRENNDGVTNVIADKNAALKKFPQAYANTASISNSASVRSAPVLKE